MDPMGSRNFKKKLPEFPEKKSGNPDSGFQELGKKYP
jgi:hypothetical protein